MKVSASAPNAGGSSGWARSACRSLLASPTHNTSSKPITNSGHNAPANTATNNGHGSGSSQKAGPRQEKTGSAINALIEEVTALKAVQRDAFARTNQLLSAIKRHRSQSRKVQSTLASLRQLQQVSDG